MKRPARIVLLLLVLAFIFSMSRAHPQNPGERLAAEAALDRSLAASSLTTAGFPFHAVLRIGKAGAPFSGKVEVWWAGPDRSRVEIDSPSFRQLRIVNGDQIQENDDGDYYPRWLENFVLAVLNPIPSAANFRGRGGTVVVGPNTESCLMRDDRPGGITDQLTWGQVCFAGSEPRLKSVLTMNYNMEFSDRQPFEGKFVARTYEAEVLDHQTVAGRLEVLEPLTKPAPDLFTITKPTPAAEQITTTFVSTQEEESLLEKAPKISWPTVREGKTEGYMIVYARTDRTGQVRETAKHNSDQPGLEDFGMEQALRYKFKPLLMDGAPRQMEMPLVLHFSSHLADALPILGVAEMTKQMRGCRIAPLPRGTPPGTVTVVRVSVDETGKVTGIGPVGEVVGSAWLSALPSIEGCRFAPYLVNGRATYYKGDVELTTR